MFQRHAHARDLKEDGRVILAHGEMTGHAHEVIDGVATLDPAELEIPAADFFEEPHTGRRILMAHRTCVLTHQEHGRIIVRPEEAARGAAGERDADGNLIGLYRQGDVLLNPIGYGAWHVVRQREYQPEGIRQVAD